LAILTLCEIKLSYLISCKCKLWSWKYSLWTKKYFAGYF